MSRVTLELPADLCDRIRRKFVGESGSLEDFLVRVLEELLDDSSEVQAREEEFLEERLRGLGYLAED